jgi:uncharacterized membrane protein
MNIKTARNFIKNWDLVLVLIFSSIYIIVFSRLSILRHNAFASGYDLANMGQTVWQTFHGRPFALTGAESTISRFSIHADLILVLLSPFYLIWERITTLLVIQSVLLGLGAIPVYFLSRKVLNYGSHFNRLQSQIASLVLVIVYLLNPGVQWTNIYDFHGVSLAIPFLLSAFYFAYSRQWLGYAGMIFLALLTKEEISLFIAMLGLVIAFIFKEKVIGFITTICSIIWFLVMVFLVIPHFSSDGNYWALSWFSPLNQSSQIFSLRYLVDLIQRFTISADTRGYYLNLLKPFGFLPIIAFPWLILSLPELLINILSSQAQMRSIYFHYDSGIIPSLVIASIFAIRNLNLAFLDIRNHFFPHIKEKSLKSFFYVFLGLLLFISLRFNYHYSPLPTTPSCWCIMYKVSDEDREFNKVLRTIPQSASITASSEVRPHLTRREFSYNLPSATSSAQYVAMIDQNRLVGDYSPKEFELQLLKDSVFLKTHELISHIGHFYLFKKK